MTTPYWLSSDYRALLAAVKADPDADLPRLVLADWLDDRGEAERAELIRLMCDLERTRPHPDFHRIHIRLTEIDDSFGVYDGPSGLERLFATAGLPTDFPVWLYGEYPYPELPNAGPRPGQVAWVRRGFIESLTCPADVWVAHSDALLAREPVRRVALTTQPELVTELPSGQSLVGDESAGRVFGTARCLTAGADVDGLFNTRLTVGLLRLRWPGVAFTLPPQESPNNGMNYASVRAQLEAWQPRPVRLTHSPTPAEAVIAGEAERHGVRPGEVSLVPSPRPQSVYGTHRIYCTCRDGGSNHRPILAANPVRSFDLAVVNLDRMAFADGGRRRWETWAGRCAHCRRVYATEPVLTDRLGDVRVTATPGGVTFGADLGDDDDS